MPGFQKTISEVLHWGFDESNMLDQSAATKLKTIFVLGNMFGLGGIRYRGENIMRLSLDRGGRTTRDYEGPQVSPLSRTIVKISLALFPVWGFLFILFLIAVFAGKNCFKLHLIGMRGRGWKLGCLETVFVFLAKTKFYLPIKLLFKLETYVSSFPYNFKMRIKSLVRKRCAKVDSLLT